MGVRSNKVRVVIVLTKNVAVPYSKKDNVFLNCNVTAPIFFQMDVCYYDCR